MREADFNLIDEKWIPVSGKDKVSLLDIFTDEGLKAIGGNPRQKIALLKLFLAITQAACTPANRNEWKTLGKSGMASACRDYLKKWRDKFHLFGDEPFLQMPVRKAKADSPGSLQPEIATGNNLRFTHFQCERKLDQAGLALLLLTEMSMCLGGKRYDKTCVLAPNYSKRTAPPGPGIGGRGYLHTFLTGASIIETIWLNLLTQEDIGQLSNLPSGLGTPPWEKMPQTEMDEIAEELRNSLQGRLVPMARFCLLEDNKIHFTEGIPPKAAQEGACDPSAAIKSDGKGFRMLWADPDKRPWRSLSSLLSFLDANSKKDFECFQLINCLPRLNDLDDMEQFGIWSGGMKVSGTSGEQKVSGSDDIVESEIQMSVRDLNRNWFAQLTRQMEWLENIAKKLYACIIGYMKEFSAENTGAAGVASAMFWEQAEIYWPDLMLACYKTEKLPEVQASFLRLLYKCYDEKCPSDTPRQLEAWVIHRPKIKSPSSPTGMLSGNATSDAPGGGEKDESQLLAARQKDDKAMKAKGMAQRPVQGTLL